MTDLILFAAVPFALVLLPCLAANFILKLRRALWLASVSANNGAALLPGRA